MRISARLGLVLGICVSFSAFASPVSSLFRSGEKEGAQEFTELLTKFGVKESSRTDLVEGLHVAMKAVADGTIPSTDAAFEQAIRKSDRIPEAAKNDLIALMKKDITALDQADVARLTNVLSSSAEGSRVGRAVVACQTCVSEDLAKLGVVRIAHESSPEASAILAKLPSGAALNAELVKTSKALKAAIQPSQMSGLSDVEKKYLLRALQVTTSGTATEQNLGKEILRFNTDTKGEGYISNKLWTLLTPAEGLQEVDMERMAKVMKQISDQPGMTPEQRTRALNKWFEKNADTPALQAKLDEMKSRRSMYNGKACSGCWCTF